MGFAFAARAGLPKFRDAGVGRRGLRLLRRMLIARRDGVSCWRFVARSHAVVASRRVSVTFKGRERRPIFAIAVELVVLMSSHP